MVKCRQAAEMIATGSHRQSYSRVSAERPGSEMEMEMGRGAKVFDDFDQ